jgi:hypothetical protein
LRWVNCVALACLVKAQPAVQELVVLQGQLAALVETVHLAAEWVAAMPTRKYMAVLMAQPRDKRRNRIGYYGG